MLIISGTDEWKKAHPGAVIGLLEISGVDNRSDSLRLDERKRETEARLREDYAGFTRQDFLSLPVMAAYLVLVAVIFVSINLLVDILYFVVDPRLRADKAVAAGNQE